LILVDSSVWIDFLGDSDTPQTVRLQQLLASRLRVGVADLVLTEVLQGTRDETHFRNTLAILHNFPVVTVVDVSVARQAARNYQALRRLGRTPRKTIDTLIATRCIVDNIPLLFADRDFHAFVEHLNLRSALDDTGLN
jgi:predicted nucleic acid-binding protein